MVMRCLELNTKQTNRRTLSGYDAAAVQEEEAEKRPHLVEELDLLLDLLPEVCVQELLQLRVVLRDGPAVGALQVPPGTSNDQTIKQSNLDPVYQ